MQCHLIILICKCVLCFTNVGTALSLLLVHRRHRVVETLFTKGLSILGGSPGVVVILGCQLDGIYKHSDHGLLVHFCSGGVFIGRRGLRFLF